MIQTAIRLKTRVLPGHRIEVVVPEFAEGEDIELILLSEPAQVGIQEKPSMLDFLQTVPPGPRPFAIWEEYELALKAKKDSW